MSAVCGKGWATRCAHSTGRICRCRCGGANHGRATATLRAGTPRHSNFSIVRSNATELVLRDVGPWNQYLTITNDASHVVEYFADVLRGRRLLYYDSGGELTELLVQDGRFAGFAAMQAVSLAELRRQIADRFTLDLTHEATPQVFPELAAAVREAEEAATPVVLITDAFSVSREEGAPRILTRREWARADGTKGAKACKHATHLGAGVGGGVRGMSFRVCTATTACRAHFGQEIRDAELRAAQATSRATSGRATEPAKESKWEKEARLEREAKARFVKAQPAVLAAIAKAIGTASTKLGGPLDVIVSHGVAWPKAKDGPHVPRGTTPEDLMRHLAWRELTRNLYNAHKDLSAAGKQLGVDVAKIVKDAQPKPAAKGKAAAKGKPAKKAGKAAR